MIRSYRVWSSVMGGWYLLVVASLVAHPPGAETRIRPAADNSGTVTVPAHTTFFQNAGGWQFVAGVFAAVAVALLLTAWLRWQALGRVHLAAMVVCYVFGIGYVTTNIVLNQAFLAGAFALVVAAGHIVIRKQRFAVIVDEALRDTP